MNGTSTEDHHDDEHVATNHEHEELIAIAAVFALGSMALAIACIALRRRNIINTTTTRAVVLARLASCYFLVRAAYLLLLSIHLSIHVHAAVMFALLGAGQMLFLLCYFRILQQWCRINSSAFQRHPSFKTMHHVQLVFEAVLYPAYVITVIAGIAAQDQEAILIFTWMFAAAHALIGFVVLIYGGLLLLALQTIRGSRQATNEKKNRVTQRRILLIIACVAVSMLLRTVFVVQHLVGDGDQDDDHREISSLDQFTWHDWEINTVGTSAYFFVLDFTPMMILVWRQVRAGYRVTVVQCDSVKRTTYLRRRQAAEASTNTGLEDDA